MAIVARPRRLHGGRARGALFFAAAAAALLVAAWVWLAGRGAPRAGGAAPRRQTTKGAGQAWQARGAAARTEPAPPRPAGAALQAAPPGAAADGAARPETASRREDAPAGPEDATGQDTAESPAKHFPHPSEQLLAMMLSTPPENVMPPLPQLDPDDEGLNADALDAMTNALVIYETDGEGLEALKEGVADAKAQLAEIVAQGGSVAEALNELREWQNEGVEIRNEAIAAINAIEDDGEAAEAFGEANETLAREGIAPIRPEEVGMDVEDEEE